MKNQLFKIALCILVLALAGLACGGGGGTAQATPTNIPTNIPTNPSNTPTLPPAVQVSPGWYQFTNGNYVREIALSDGVLYAATGGGAVVWDLTTGESTKYTVLDGYPTNDILAVAACPIPEMRIIYGTEYGLSIYDPVTGSLEQWDSSNSEMEDDAVESLDCDAVNKTLYIGYTWGLNIFKAAAGTWKYLDEDAGLATDWVSQVAIVGGDTWVVSNFGVTQIKADGTFVPFTEDLGNIPDDGIEAVVGDANGNVWLATFDGLMKYSNGEFKVYNSDNTADFPFLSSFTGVVVDSGGMIWAGNYFGTLCQFDPAAEKCIATYEDQDGMAGSVSDLIISGDDEIFFASDDGTGISLFDGSTWTAFLRDEILPANRADALAITPDGTVLVGGSFGLRQFPSTAADKPWQEIDFDGYGVYAFFGTPEGMWFGSGEGVSFYDYGSEAWTTLASGDPGVGIASGTPSTLTVDGQGRLWVGTGSGLTVWDGTKYTFYDLLNQTEIDEKWSPKSVYSVLYDGKNVWVGASGALYRFDEADQMTRWDEQIEGPFSIFSPGFYDLALENDGSILIAAGDKLLRYSSDKFSEVYKAESDITTLLVTDSGEWWLATMNSGVLHYDGNTWTSLTTADGLPSNHFYTHAILIDDLGTIWFAPQQGGLARWVR
jgi:ligand-binding sensor domain-containing protein